MVEQEVERGQLEDRLASKHSLYKTADSLQRTSFLHQGKLQGDSISSSNVVKSKSDGLQYEDVPRAVTSELNASETRVPPTLLAYSGEHTHSLSLSDTDEDHTDYQPAVSANIPVASPVLAVPHIKNDKRNSRRFTNNFTDNLPPKSKFMDDLPPKPTIESTSILPKPSIKDTVLPPVDTTLSESSAKPSVESTLLAKNKKSGRVVASRYMSGTTKNTKPKSMTHQQSARAKTGIASKPRYKPTSQRSQVSGSSSHKKQPKAKPSMMLSSADRSAASNKSNVKRFAEVDGFKVPTAPPFSKSSLSSDPQEEFFQTPVNSLKGITTSTPLHAGTHDGSYLAGFGVLPSAIKSSKMINTLDKGPHVDDLEMELLYDRLIQLVYMDILSCRALKQQETEAKAQLHHLWQKVEDHKEQCFMLAKKVEEKERNLATDKAIDAQLGGLGPVHAKLPAVEQQHRVMSRALDTTRHDMVMEGILPLQEERVKTELGEAEALLGNINASVQEKLAGSVEFSTSFEAIVEILDKEYFELDKCSEEISEVLHAQVTNSSLNFELACHLP